jgi:flagellar hook assembly protein FlgD
VSVLSNGATGHARIAFSLAQAADVHVDVVDVAGRIVRRVLDEHRLPGEHSVTWDGRDGAARRVGSGVFVLRVSAGENVRSMKMLRLR